MSSRQPTATSIATKADSNEKLQVTAHEDVVPRLGERGSEFSLEDERRPIRKLDMRIMPMACIMYLFACELQALSPRRCEDADGTCRSGQDELGECAAAGSA